MKLNLDLVEEISLERTMDYGEYPVYKVTFKADGTAIYEGKNNVEKIGRFSGEICVHDFNWLVELMDKLNFLELKDNYMESNSNATKVITTLKYNGVEKKINNYEDNGPMELWTIEKVIDGIIFDIYWEE